MSAETSSGGDPGAVIPVAPTGAAARRARPREPLDAGPPPRLSSPVPGGDPAPLEDRSGTLRGIRGPGWVANLVRAALAAVAAILVLAFLFDDRGTALLLLAVLALVGLIALKFTNLVRSGAVSWTLLLSITGLLCYQATIAGGLRDEVILAFPCLLIFASIFGTPRHFLAMLGLLVATMAGITVLNVTGWHVNEPQTSDAMTFVYDLFVLLMTAFLIWVHARDLRRTMDNLKRENLRLADSNAHIERLAHHDPLTGLPNRLLARLRVEQAIAMARRSGRSIAFLFLDLDDFKAVNDSVGHVAADQLLREVAARLSSMVRGCDTVSRQGGDEFLVVLESVRDEHETTLVAARIVAGFARAIAVDGVDLYLTASLGVAMFPRDGEDFDALLKNADMAMYQAKDGGRNMYRFYDERIGQDVKEAVGLVAAIRVALARGEFRLHYQPQFELASGRIVGAEALIRWRHAELGAVPPSKFIPLAERSGLIAEVGRWVLLEACRQARQWQLAGADGLVVAVNISPVQLRRDDLEHDVLGALAASGLPPGLLELELTESVLVADTAQLHGLIGRLQAGGLRFAIDDFGVGYSNLGYLRRFAVDRLKVDQSFIQRMTADEGDASIVRAIVDVANTFELETVGEGVEDAATRDRLIGAGCRFGQGYFWSPALPPDEFATFLRSHGAIA